MSDSTGILTGIGGFIAKSLSLFLSPLGPQSSPDISSVLKGTDAGHDGAPDADNEGSRVNHCGSLFKRRLERKDVICRDELKLWEVECHVSRCSRFSVWKREG